MTKQAGHHCRVDGVHRCREQDHCPACKVGTLVKHYEWESGWKYWRECRWCDFRTTHQPCCEYPITLL